MFDPIFIEDIAEAFKPLIKYATEEFGNKASRIQSFISDYMYMYSDDSHSFFKHIDTRKYIKLPRK